ncbi:MAG: hypothetical protein IJB97_03335 [Clostridia bacterium]|nr:hypothetical protein [Clostridia bacterium]
MKKQEIEKIEKILEVSDKEVSTKKFAEVWEEIKDRNPNVKQSVRTPSRKVNRKRLALVASIVGVLLVGGSVAPIIVHSVNQADIYYFNIEDLQVVDVDEDMLYQALETAKIGHVNFDGFDLQECKLYQTKNEAQTKGALVKFSDSAYSLNVKFFDETVKYSKKLYADYTLTYSVNGADIHYKLKESYESQGLYVYAIKANYNSVNYFMEYYCFTDNIQPFFDSFFS